MKTYRIRPLYILENSAILVFPLIMTLVILFEGEAATINEWVGVSIFWLIGIIFLIFISASKLEIDKGRVRGYVLGILRSDISPSDVEGLEYKNLFRGGLGVGKGLLISVRTQKGRKNLSIGERAYGREAVEHVRRVLEGHSVA